MQAIEAYQDREKICVRYQKPADNNMVAMFTKCYSKGDDGYEEALMILEQQSKNV